MIRVKHSFMATDSQGNEVFIAKGDKVSEISDAGPVFKDDSQGWPESMSWNAIFRLTTPSWSELVTYDAVKLLQNLVD